MPEGVNSKRTSHSLATLRALTSGGVNSQRRRAFCASSAKYLLGPGFSKSAEETLPAGSTWARRVTRTLPEMVARALSGMSGIISSSTSPFAEPALRLDPEAGELFVASGGAFVSVRSVAVEGEALGAWETSLAEDFAAVALDASRDESRPEAEEGEF